MIHTLHTLARFFPYWALVVVIILFELGQFFRRRNRTGKTAFFWLSGAGLIVATALWFVYRGDLHSDDWVRAMTQASP